MKPSHSFREWRARDGRRFIIVLCAIVLFTGCRPKPEVPAVPVNELDSHLSAGINDARSRVAASPTDAEAWGRYGQYLDAAEFHAEAMRCYAEAHRLDPASPGWPHLLGLLELQGDHEKALLHLRTAARLAGATNDAPRLRIVQALIERGRFQRAQTELEPWLAQAPHHPAGRLEWARLQLATGHERAAAEALAPCVTNPFTARPAILLLSQIRARQGSNEVAAALARRATTMPKPFDWPDPFLREVQALRADRARRADRANGLISQQRFSEADTILKELLAQNPEDAEALLLMGRSLLQQRKCAEAEEFFRAHLKTSPDSLNGLTQLGLALMCQQRWPAASGTFERVIGIKPDLAQGHANLAVVRSRMGDGAAAIRSYRDALRCSPGDANAHAGLAEELARAGDNEAALDHARRSLAIDPAQERAKNLLKQLEPK